MSSVVPIQPSAGVFYPVDNIASHHSHPCIASLKSTRVILVDRRHTAGATQLHRGLILSGDLNARAQKRSSRKAAPSTLFWVFPGHYFDKSCCFCFKILISTRGKWWEYTVRHLLREVFKNVYHINTPFLTDVFALQGNLTQVFRAQPTLKSSHPMEKNNVNYFLSSSHTNAFIYFLQLFSHLPPSFSFVCSVQFF